MTKLEEFCGEILNWTSTQMYILKVLPTKDKTYNYAKDLYYSQYSRDLPISVLNNYKPT